MKVGQILQIALFLQQLGCMLCSSSGSTSSSQTNGDQSAISSFLMRQEMLRVDWQIPLSKLKCMDTGLPPKLTVISPTVSYHEEMYITVEIDLSMFDGSDTNGSGILEPDDVFFCLNESHSQQCIGSQNLDYYQSNFRSSYLSLSKEIKPVNSKQSGSTTSEDDNRTQQYVTLTVSERLMELYSYKFVYDIVVKVWQKKPANAAGLPCPFDCLSRGSCVDGFCNCDSTFIGRSCEFKLESIEGDRRPKLGYNEVKWVRVDSPSPLILLDFMSGFFQFVTFTDSKRYKIASQYLLNRPQKIIIDKRYVLERDASSVSVGTMEEEEEYLTNQSTDQANNRNTSVIMCMFSYSKDTHFGLVLNEKKITEIAAEQDKDLANAQSTGVKTFLQVVLAVIVILSIFLLRVVYKQYLEQKSKIDVLKLYQSKEFREIAEELQQEDACRICLEGYLENTRVRIHHKCMKVFHKGCFDKWALTGNNQKCPQCRDEYEDELIDALQNLAQKEAQMKIVSEYDQANQESLNLSMNGDNQIEIPFVANVELEMESVDRNRNNQASNEGRQSLTPAQMLARIDRTGLFDEPSTFQGIPNESDNDDGGFSSAGGLKKYSQVPAKGSVDLSDYQLEQQQQLYQQPRNPQKDSHFALRNDVGDEENPNRQEEDDEEYDEDEEDVEEIDEEDEDDEDDDEEEGGEDDDDDGDEDGEDDEEQDEDGGEEGEGDEDEEEEEGDDNGNEQEEEEVDDDNGEDGVEIGEKSDQIKSSLLKE